MLLCTRAGRLSHPKSQEIKIKKLKSTQAARLVAYSCCFKQEYTAHVHGTRGYHVCLRLFRRIGAPASLKNCAFTYTRRSSFTSQITRNKKTEKHASSTAGCLLRLFQARTHCSCTWRTGLSCLFAFVLTYRRSGITAKRCFYLHAQVNFHTPNHKK